MPHEVFAGVRVRGCVPRECAIRPLSVYFVEGLCDRACIGMERFVERLHWKGTTLRTPSVTRWMFLISTSLVFVRVFVLFCESYSQVNSERMSDDQLLELCTRGAAAESTKFRQLCLQAKADRAAPLVFKAILKALRTTFSDFTESFNSPTRIAILLLFCLSGLALPVVKAVSTLATSYLGPDPLARIQGLHLHDDEDQEACEVVVLNGGKSTGGSWTNRLRRLPVRMVGRRNRLTMTSLSDDVGEESVWTSVKLGDFEARA